MLAEELATFASVVRFEALPASTRRAAQRCVLDTVGVLVAGSRGPLAPVLRSGLAAHGHGGHSTIVGVKEPVAAPVAAMANSAAGHALEADDFHRGATVHPGIVVVPTALAVAEEAGASGRDLLAAVVAGYEVMIRVGLGARGSQYRRGFHPTATCGVFGAAAAAGRLYNLPPQALVAALGIAGTGAGGLLAYKAEGDWTKAVQVGRSAAWGIEAAWLARAGCSGPSGILEGGWGFLRAFGEVADPALVTDGLGQVFAIEGVSVKPYPCCRFVHAPVEALLSLLRAENIDPASIVAIEVATHEQAIRSTMVPTERKYRPRTVVDAQFSLPFCLAAAVIRKQLTPREFEPEALADASILALADRVRALVDADHTAAFPAHTPARVTVQTGQGAFTREVLDPLGDPERPLSDVELEAKFLGLADPVLTSQGGVLLLDKLRTIERVSAARDLLALLTQEQE